MSLNLKAGDEVCRGKYRLIRLLGSGGFAQVFEAENLATKRRVALKAVHGDSAGTEVVERLRREAVVSSRVRHRHVVDVYDLEEEAGVWFLVMEYVRGETLREALDRSGLPADVATTLLISVMGGLAVMHRHGVVHRDIKPDNIYLARQHDTTQVVAKLLDFGICKVEQPDPELPPLTRAGTQGMGTLMYMSPEQYADSASVDARADVYSLGVVLYECLTGQAPYAAASQRELMLQILTKSPPSPHELRPSIPDALSGIVMKAMARDVADRYASVDELAGALLPYASEQLPEADSLLGPRHSLPPPASSPRPRRRVGWLAALATMLGAQVLAIYWAVTSLDVRTPAAALFSPHGNALAGLLLPPLPSRARSLVIKAGRVASSRADVPVQVFCEIPGTELFINGERIGAVVSGGPMQLNLPPGLYRFEALRAGSVVASDLQLVEPGGAVELHLRLPSGAAEPAEPAPLQVRAPLGAAALVSTAPRGPTDELALPERDDALLRDRLSEVVEAHQAELQQCYERAYQQQPVPSEPVSVELELTIAASGSVAVVRTLGDVPPGLQECFEHSVRGWAFARAPHATQLRFPMVFRRASGAPLTSAQLSAVVARSKGMLQRCADPSYGAGVLRLDVDMEVLPSGAVSSVAIESEHPELDACVSRLVRLWQFPAAEVATRTSFPVLLLPGA